MRNGTKFLAQVIVSAALASAVCGPVVAQQLIPASAPAGGITAVRASDKQVADFRANPASILRGNPLGGMQLAALVKSLLLADPTLLDTVLALVAEANSMQAPSIGSGIGQAIRTLQAVDPRLAQSMQEKAVATKNEAMIAGLTAGLNDTQTFATGGGAGGVSGGGSGPVGGTGGGGGGGGGAGGSQPGSSAFSNRGAFNGAFTSGVAVTCTRSVSPRRNCG